MPSRWSKRPIARSALIVLHSACAKKATMPQPVSSLSDLEPGRVVRGFTAVSLYLDDADQPIGARLVHDRTGFTLDLLYIESAPQAFLWVNTFPTSDRGEPHTQEHLLLGKGEKGRHAAGVEEMSLAQSSAFTMQWRTAYHFHTIAGVDAFFTVLESKLDALLHPDYTDEEIRREVRNFGVVEDRDDGSLRLEEKGTVYTEMVRSFESPSRRMWRELGILLYGPDHPLARSSGGLPAAIRELTPADIRAFHRANYHLANLGMIGAFPRSLALTDLLDCTADILDRVGAEPAGDRVVEREADLPAPVTAPATIELVDYPHESARRPGPVVFAWPATLELELEEQTLLEIFLSAFAGDESTNLYRLLIASDTRTADIGATGVWGWVSSDQGHPIYVGLSDVDRGQLDDAHLATIRDRIARELARVASWKDGAPELVAFNQRTRSRIAETRRSLTKFLDSPPGFGYRSSGAAWLGHLHDLQRAPRFAKSVTLRPELEAITALLSDDRNVWAERLHRWGLDRPPRFAVGAIARPELVTEDAAERTERIEAEMKRLAASYGTSDPAATLARFRADYDRRTAELEAARTAGQLPPLTPTPPLTLDDQLAFEVTELDDRVPLVTSTFDNMTGGTVGAALRLDSLDPTLLELLPALPALMTEVGIYRDGEVIPHDVMKERLRREILDLGIHFATNFRAGRAEMVITGAGNDRDETLRALEWMERVIFFPDWRPENLTRIRDVVDQMATATRNRMLGAEEHWADDPPRIYARQDHPVLARTSSFLTQAHDLHRLRWMLRDGGADLAGITRLLIGLGELGGERPREELRRLATALAGDAATGDSGPAELAAELAALSRSGRKLAAEAGKDLAQLVGDLPDGSLAADWRYLCREISADLTTPPAEVLTRLHRARASLLFRDNLRLYAVGPARIHTAIASGVEQLVDQLDPAPVTRPRYSEQRFIETRLRQRDPGVKTPRFLALVNPNTQGGVFVNSAPGFSYFDRDDDPLLDFLASNLYAGHGAHGIFMKTWAAGLAYSNGLRGSLSEGRVKYYAERCPELAQTMGFVVGELEGARATPELAGYALAQVFSSRVAASYEGRGAAMAADLADGVTPEVVRGFRTRLLELSRRPDFADQLAQRVTRVYGQLLPGLGPKSAEVPNAQYFVIGPEKQLGSYEKYLRAVDDPNAVLYRIYPRDFWIPAAEL